MSAVLLDPAIENKLDKEVIRLASQYGVEAKSMLKDADNPYFKLFEARLLLSYIIHTGVSYKFFDLISNYTPFSEKDWAQMLDISIKTLHRYRNAQAHFRPLQSERILELAEVTNLGLVTFGDIEKFKRWLDTPNFALGKLKPMELLRDSYGKELVVAELHHINHGILA